MLVGLQIQKLTDFPLAGKQPASGWYLQQAGFAPPPFALGFWRCPGRAWFVPVELERSLACDDSLSLARCWPQSGFLAPSRTLGKSAVTDNADGKFWFR
jgi:hypothetical protein